MDWTRWIGLPHEFGADPENGVGADCLVMAWRILDHAGIKHPPFNAYWLEAARQNRWSEIEMIWRDSMVELSTAEENALTLFRNGPNGLGVGIVVDDGLLIVHHRRGVRWVPLSFIPDLRFYTFR